MSAFVWLLQFRLKLNLDALFVWLAVQYTWGCLVITLLLELRHVKDWVQHNSLGFCYGFVLCSVRSVWWMWKIRAVIPTLVLLQDTLMYFHFAAFSKNQVEKNFNADSRLFPEYGPCVLCWGPEQSYDALAIVTLEAGSLFFGPCGVIPSIQELGLSVNNNYNDRDRLLPQHATVMVRLYPFFLNFKAREEHKGWTVAQSANLGVLPAKKNKARQKKRKKEKTNKQAKTDKLWTF